MPPTNNISSPLLDDSPHLPLPLSQPPLSSLPHQSPPGLANCYVFKSRLQEYAQKVGISTPVYETVKEGPSHEPVFKSTVVVNDVRYESLPGFINRKAAEQSAAEVALAELHRSGQLLEAVHETGLCKNLLQEYAQKMNYAIPSYVCTRSSSGSSLYTCTVDIGGIQYIGAAASTKKEAEIKAARTALLAMQGQAHATADGASPYTVLPGKRKAKEQEAQKVKPRKQLKQKKANFKNKWSKNRFLQNKNGQRVKINKEEPQDTFNEDTSSCTLSKEMEISNDKDSYVQHEGSVFNEIQQSGNVMAAEVNNC